MAVKGLSAGLGGLESAPEVNPEQPAQIKNVIESRTITITTITSNTIATSALIPSSPIKCPRTLCKDSMTPAIVPLSR